jgi:hypothetical protein
VVEIGTLRRRDAQSTVRDHFVEVLRRTAGAT